MAAQDDESESTPTASGALSSSGIFLRVLDTLKGETTHLLVGGLALMVNSITNLSFPRIMGKAIDIATGKDPSGLAPSRFFIAATGVFALGAAASYVRVSSLGMVTERVASKLRRKLFQSIVHQDMKFFDTRKSGELVSRISADVDVLSHSITSYATGIIRGLNSAIGATVMLLLLSPRLTLVTISLVPFLGSAAALYGKRVSRMSKRYQNQVAATAAFAQEKIANIQTVKMFARENDECRTFSRLIEQSSAIARRWKTMEGVFLSSLNFTVNSSFLAVLFTGSRLVNSGSLTVGTLTSFAMYSVMVGVGFAGLGRSYGDVKRVLGCSEELFSILEMRPKSKKGEGRILSTESVSAELGKTSSPALSLEFKNVSFSYQTRRGLKALDNVSFKLLPGRVVALVGPSGAGKSTVAKLLTQLYEPSEGSILMNDVEISTLDRSWYMDQIGVVSQEPALFFGTIYENILYGHPSASKEDVEKAAKQANAHDFIQELPNGYETEVGERGLQLSGGQKQRIAIARAVLKNPQILLFDEATSSLDGESERLVQDALDRVIGERKRAVLVIAHRSTTIKKADVIFIIKEGRIIDSGTYQELLEKEAGHLQHLMAESSI